MAVAQVESWSLGVVVRNHRVGFRLLPLDIRVVGREVEVGFALELLGTHEPRGRTCTPACRDCRRVLLGLLEVADWVLPLGRNSTDGANKGYEKLTRYVSAGGGQPEVLLLIRIVHRRRFEDANDGWGLQFLEEARHFLLDAGCRQLPSSGSGAQPIEQLER